ncbi:MAG: hypothetical protein J2P36_02550 [Ktedonobacteraceae bacterium]|nr:hypothetical protein [Ktedonobacteraceae bacterium]
MPRNGDMGDHYQEGSGTSDNSFRAIYEDRASGSAPVSDHYPGDNSAQGTGWSETDYGAELLKSIFPATDKPITGKVGDMQYDVHQHPDGHTVLVTPGTEKLGQYSHEQGDHRLNDDRYTYENTCGIVCCEEHARRFTDPEMRNPDLNEHNMLSFALDQGFCSLKEGDEGSPDLKEHMPSILRAYGVHAEFKENGSLSQIAQIVEEGREDGPTSGKGVIAGVNAGALWQHDEGMTEEDIRACTGDGYVNHTVSVIGIEWNPLIESYPELKADPTMIEAVRVNDPGSGDRNRRYTREQFEEAFLGKGNPNLHLNGTFLVTEPVKRDLAS